MIIGKEGMGKKKKKLLNITLKNVTAAGWIVSEG